METKGIWQGVLGEIELSVPHASFTTWFKNTELEEIRDGVAVVAVPNIFVKAQLDKKFLSQVCDVLKRTDIAPNGVLFEVKTEGKKHAISRDLSVDKDTERIVESLILPSRKSSTTNLNPRYTFDNFIVGSSNDLAYAAARAVADHPGDKYNPLFLYGGAGLGKTHLIQAIGNDIVRRQPKARVLYTTTEAFVNEFLDYIRFKKQGFSDKYRNVDVLIVDDMQFIANKEKTQDEFFHTFNDLHQNNKQIIISSDKPPKSIPTLTDRLRSRFEWGMAIDIQMPDYETRCAIITAKAGQSGMELDPSVVEYLATNIKTNIRELEGALNQILAYSEMSGITPDVAITEGMISNIKKTRPQHITAKQIIDKTARYFQIDPKDICSPKRDRHIVVPRQIAMYLLRNELKLSFPVIAKELGRKDHTTAMHSVEKITRESKLNMTVREQISDIQERLYV
ncbi:chromosomal replication initiator protein DnaA [Candidatus Saccharibacteria bacterium]|nr:chromosomal replication initiator protein DnaA [Candidatus Saccharibacteria bacterium]